MCYFVGRKHRLNERVQCDSLLKSVRKKLSFSMSIQPFNPIFVLIHLCSVETDEHFFPLHNLKRKSSKDWKGIYIKWHQFSSCTWTFISIIIMGVQWSNINYCRNLVISTFHHSFDNSISFPSSSIFLHYMKIFYGFLYSCQKGTNSKSDKQCTDSINK